MIRECAPGKIILFGEHAVVYGRPALAVPVLGLKACASISTLESTPQNEIMLQSDALNLSAPLSSLPAQHPLSRVCQLTFDKLRMKSPPAMHIHIKSDIPPSAGLGSGAAVSVAVIRALSRFLDSPLETVEVNQLAFEVEKIHHGTPSGIDNTVIAYEKPVFFVRGKDLESFQVRTPFTLLIADSGTKACTAESVGSVRKAWEKNPDRYEYLFNSIGAVTTNARKALAAGSLRKVGKLMNENQKLLEEIGVSAPVNTRLAEAANRAGAWGAKLSGGGLGGNVIAMAPSDRIDAVSNAMLAAGAAACYRTEVA